MERIRLVAYQSKEKNFFKIFLKIKKMIKLIKNCIKK